MPSKKKTAAQKPATPAAPKKAATKTSAKKSASPRKAEPKVAAKKTAARSRPTATEASAAVPPKGAKKPAAKSAAKEAPGAAAANGKDKPKASDLLRRTKHHTPAIFKVGTRKAAPVVFTLEDVREILKKRSREEAKIAQTKPERAAKKAVVRPKPEPLPEVTQAASKHAAASLADILGFGGGAFGAAPAQRAVPRKWKRFHQLLVELRNHVNQSLGMHAEDTLKRSQKEDTGDLSTSSDAGTDSFDRDFALSVVSSEQEALREIEAAIERIHKGSYGTCEITGEAISEERLEAVPFTRYSLEGQRQHEQTARRRIARSGSILSEGAEGVSFGDDDGDN
jgi:RNA polymerase-binding transcription factor DksA